MAFPKKTILELKAIPENEFLSFQSILLLQKATKRTARNNNEFLSVEFADQTGAFTATCFSDSPPFEVLKNAPLGAIFQIEGSTDFYQGKFSPRLTKVRPLSEQEMEEGNWLSRLTESAPEDATVLWAQLTQFIDAIPHEILRATVKTVLEEIEEIFRRSPAAIAMHHAYRHGLLEHTVHVAHACRVLLPLYPEVDPSLAMAGAILHDVGKTAEYIGGSLPGTTKKSRIGILQGHIILGYRLVRKASLQNKLSESLRERLEHIILSHQGQLEWGAAVLAATPEAVFVSLLDNLDARMGMVARALRQTPSEKEFSDFLPGLQSELLTEPPSLL